jgi:hypothetical protein
MTSAIPFTDLAASDRPLQPGECASLAERAAGLLDPAALALARAGASVVLWEDEHSVSWLNAMPERRDTGYHDHDGSAVGVYVIEGSVTNEGLPIGGPRRVHRYGPGDAFSFPGSGIHRMDHDAGRSPSTSTRRRCAPSATTRSSEACSSARRVRRTRPHPRARAC